MEGHIQQALPRLLFGSDIGLSFDIGLINMYAESFEVFWCHLLSALIFFLSSHCLVMRARCCTWVLCGGPFFGCFFIVLIFLSFLRHLNQIHIPCWLLKKLSLTKKCVDPFLLFMGGFQLWSPLLNHCLSYPWDTYLWNKTIRII